MLNFRIEKKKIQLICHEKVNCDYYNWALQPSSSEFLEYRVSRKGDERPLIRELCKTKFQVFLMA